jgi:hypothetical protein
MLDRPAKSEFTYDARDLSRRAVAAWPVIYPELVDGRGWARDHVRQLGPDYVRPDPNSRLRAAGWPRAVGLYGPSAYDAKGNVGSWYCVGYESGGARGDDVLDLVVFLTGGASRRVAAEFLSDLLDRVVVVKVRAA